LEALQRAAVGGFQIFQVGTGIPKGPVAYSSPEHFRLLEHAARETDRLGLEFAMHNCPGWSSNGGPWITPQLAMQQMMRSETFARAGRTSRSCFRGLLRGRATTAMQSCGRFLRYPVKTGPCTSY